MKRRTEQKGARMPKKALAIRSNYGSEGCQDVRHLDRLMSFVICEGRRRVEP